MSLVIDTGVEPVHKPKRRDVFEFDKEVASIFENMAVRSIPTYAETHRVHSRLVKDFIDTRMESHGERYTFSIADIGSSTGVFIKMLMHTYGRTSFLEPLDGIEVSAIDPSEPMMHKLSVSLPWVNTIVSDTNMLRDVSAYFDVVNASYLLQFIRPELQLETLQTIADSMNKGSMLLLSQKETQGTKWLTDAFSRQYIQFRRDNGYTDEEIINKTAALQNSMWPIDYATLLQYLDAVGFTSVQETTRWLNFNSLICFKR